MIKFFKQLMWLFCMSECILRLTGSIEYPHDIDHLNLLERDLTYRFCRFKLYQIE